MEKGNVDTVDTIEAIKARCSQRRFKEGDIPEDVIADVLEAFRRAPSWANTQCWELILVRDKALKERIAKEVVGEGNPAFKGVTRAPVVIVALAKEGLSGFYQGNAVTDKGDWFMYDVGIAMQNLCLAAHAHGLGTVHVGAIDAKKAEEILEVPDGTRVVVLTPLGYPEKEGKSPPRKEITDFVFYDGYGKKA